MLSMSALYACSGSVSDFIVPEPADGFQHDGQCVAVYFRSVGRDRNHRCRQEPAASLHPGTWSNEL